jgi:uncharacterized protein DUF3179
VNVATAKPARRTLWRAFAALTVPLIVASPVSSQTLNGFDLRGALVPSAEILAGGPPRDGIPAINAPKFVPASAANLRGTDRVLGLAAEGVAKAYPVRILNWLEIVNDRLGDDAIAVTYCPLCGTGIAYSAQIAGRAATFRVSGLLYNSDLLLYDRSTQSLWSQILGRAVAGPLKGERLIPVALMHTTWADWSTQHPDTLVLSEDTGFRRDYSRDPYAGYASSGDVMFPISRESDRFPPKEPVLGVEWKGHRKSYAFSELAKALGKRTQGTLDDRLGGERLSIFFDREHRSARALDSAGREIPAYVAFWFAWYAFFPEAEVYATAAGAR